MNQPHIDLVEQLKASNGKINDAVVQFDPISSKRPSTSLFPFRENEPEYSLLKDPVTQDKNRYGNPIDLIVKESDANVSLHINGVDEVGFNPNRNKQHAFHFTADNCIGCHACESACSEKNDLPPHLSFRSVGYVEGGSYPDFQRINISMACNHCDDPVCLKGCPTRAYTKHPEYGAVIQDPDICFGCGYCTWVCPYNAPQLDPVKGQVEKCNMCVDRLEVGLKPACVSACLGNALNFGVVENTPENREQIETSIPGFPDPSISKPNIRFQQTRSLPREMKRTDSAPVKYQKTDKGKFRPVVDQKNGVARHWNFKRLSSRENPLVIFTLAIQAALGAYGLLFFGKYFSPEIASAAAVVQTPLLFAVCALAALGLLMSATHLGKPIRAYRGFNNLRHSPVAREGLGVALFFLFAGLQWLLSLPAFPLLEPWLGTMNIPLLAKLSEGFSLVALACGGTGLYFMYRCYCIKARPFWNHWQTATSFVGTAMVFGGILFISATALMAAFTAISPAAFFQPIAGVILAGLLLESIGLYAHARDMNVAENEGAASHYIQCTTFGKSYYLRNGLLGVNILLALALASGLLIAGGALFSVLAVSTVVSAVIGRTLFYVLVVPTTMPGAFFWKNKAFEEHARDIGLAEMKQVGVAPLSH